MATCARCYDHVKEGPGELCWECLERDAHVQGSKAAGYWGWLVIYGHVPYQHKVTKPYTHA